ncbi:class I SAM-dependent methyltransferase [Sphingomonas sp. M1-B02]|uniref:class I SAM-dependent methyltransferase n=1 Tax=Sphingomonas sp. M1-B02 TaxID=3114300 RepID=UPI002240B236|nr:class I SAM-dependent methyltransferase [Sphingomonas sp. S6-11]UZK66152.1 class I SAM-dependent methyltransferase [Sphingomonas sp. S6-11]
MPDRIAAHYERHAHAFDEARRKRFVERGWLDRLLLAVPAGGRILDLGCGAAEPIGRYLIDKGLRVTGVDQSETMIALSRTRFPRHDWIRADMRSFVPAYRYDAVLAWDSMFHLRHEEQAALVTQVAAWLAPGGAFLFNSGPARGVAIGCQFGEEIYHASLAPLEYRAIFEELGLLELGFAPDDAATGGRSVWLVRKEH